MVCSCVGQAIYACRAECQTCQSKVICLPLTAYHGAYELALLRFLARFSYCSRLSLIEMHMYKLQRLCHQLWQQHQHVNCMTILVRRLAGCSNGGNPRCVQVSTEFLIRHWQHCFTNCDTHSASISVRWIPAGNYPLTSPKLYIIICILPALFQIYFAYALACGYYISPSYFISFPLFFALCFLLLYPTFANIDISLYDRTHKKDFRLFCLRTEEYKHNLFVFAAGKHA